MFSGIVRSVSNDRLGFPSLASVQVRRVWKGRRSLAPLTLLDGQGGPTYPARLFQVGTELLIDGRVLRQGVVRADAYADRVLPIEQAQADLKGLAGSRSD